MEDEDDTPKIDKVTIGDAEEYFKDLGLEYDVDYKDSLRYKMSRSKKNEDLQDMVKEEIKEEEKIKEEQSKSDEEEDSLTDDLFNDFDEEEKDSEEKEENDDVEEKNLYDLIDMMYDKKE